MKFLYYFGASIVFIGIAAFMFYTQGLNNQTLIIGACVLSLFFSELHGYFLTQKNSVLTATLIAAKMFVDELGLDKQEIRDIENKIINRLTEAKQDVK